MGVVTGMVIAEMVIAEMVITEMVIAEMVVTAIEMVNSSLGVALKSGAARPEDERLEATQSNLRIRDIW
jgi:hypothetical protein